MPRSCKFCELRLVDATQLQTSLTHLYSRTWLPLPSTTNSSILKNLAAVTSPSSFPAATLLPLLLSRGLPPAPAVLLPVTPLVLLRAGGLDLMTVLLLLLARLLAGDSAGVCRRGRPGVLLLIPEGAGGRAAALGGWCRWVKRSSGVTRPTPHKQAVLHRHTAHTPSFFETQKHHNKASVAYVLTDEGPGQRGFCHCGAQPLMLQQQGA
jgi:hypothetical protein